jgi:hypothetical protein
MNRLWGLSGQALLEATRHGGAHGPSKGGGGGKTRGEPPGGPVFFQPTGPPCFVLVRPRSPNCLQKRLATQPLDYVFKERFRGSSQGEGTIGGGLCLDMIVRMAYKQ